MRRALIAGWRYGTVCLLVLQITPTAAATITGRVVDSSGQPVAGAELRIWQKLPAPDGPGVSNQQVTFDGNDVLITDAEGRFSSPDVLVGEAFARIVVEAEGMLAGRSGWIEISKSGNVAAPEITLKRLRAILGQVVDRHNRPVAGVTVLNSGDGHERVEATTGQSGKFLLNGVPEGDVFLFAEKPGYRFTGLALSAAGRSAAFTLATVDEAVEPVATLAPLLSDEEENALGRQMLHPWLDDVAQTGTESEKMWALVSLIDLDPLETFDRARTFGLGDRRRRLLQSFLVESCIARRGPLSWDDLATLIEAGDDQLGMTYQYVEATRHIDQADQARRRDWLAQALLHARRVEAPAERPRALALVADGLFALGEREQAERIAREAEAIAKQLPLDSYQLRHSFHFLAFALSHSDPNRAMAWLDKYDDVDWYQDIGGQLAVKFLPDHPDAAEEMWSRTIARDRHRERAAFSCWRYGQIADLCFGLARLDRDRARRIAQTAENQPLRVRALGAIALALAQSDPPAARKLLATIVRDELSRTVSDDGSWFESLAPSVTAAWLLPIVEQVEPELGRECLWRSVALRLPRPRRDRLDDGDVDAELATIKMLARYDRNLARTLLEPIVASLPELTRPALSRLESDHARREAFQAVGLARGIISAAVHVDPRWAVELLERFPQGDDASHRSLQSEVRGALLGTLGRHGAARWEECDAFCAGFWKPNLAVIATQADKPAADPPAGVGLALAMKENRIIVGHVLPDTPAAASGAIHAGDRILAVGQGDDAPVDTQGKRIEEAVAMIRGKNGTIVRLTIVPAGKTDDRAVVVSFARGAVKALNLFGKGEAIKIGSPAPALHFSRFGGEAREALADHAGKVVVLTFWASWCGPCKTLVDDLLKMPANKPAWRDRVDVLALSVDESKETAGEVCQARGWDKSLVGWCGAEALKIYDLRRLPGIFVIDADGKVVALGDTDVETAVDKELKE